MNIKDIKPNPDNPRIIKDDKFKKLVQSIKDFPKMMELRPIIVDENNIIQGGNMRYKALQELGYKDIPEEWVKQGKDLTPEQWQEFVIKDNVGFGEWDYDLLANDWDSDKLVGWGLDLPKDFGGKIEAEDDDYEIPDEITTDIVLGDLFEIGEHRLLCGDSTIADNIEKLMAGQKADLTLNLYARWVALKYVKGTGCKYAKCGVECSIGRKNITVAIWDDANNLVHNYKIDVTPSELIKQFGLDKPIYAELCKNGLFSKIMV